MPPQSHTQARFPDDFVAGVLDEALANGVRVQGIAGLQGSGKSTLAAQVAALARERGLQALALSIDDFYLPRRERLALGRRVHPLLATRGPPGSHDVKLACGTLDALRAGRPTALPRFDKLGDRRLPPSRWTKVTRAPDLIVFDGWFLKVPPEPTAALAEPLNALERQADPTGYWRTWCNAALKAYAPLWRRIDRLLFLHGPGFEIVPEWRWQQEQALHAAQPARAAMDRRAVARFVMAFERVSRQALHTLPAIAQRSVRLDAQRRLLC
ncbi:MAG: kinase [Proteobacteria bacterium]|nr:kinase [Pseudomonadota bacterium]MBS0461137.1 kinase [Pseudomonadota bacterium]MBS0464362.1 kinase [Pseudomonadota bacterium]